MVINSLLGSLFYFDYLILEFASSIALQRFLGTRISPLFIIIWDTILCLHATPYNYACFFILRTLLGIFKSLVTPAMVIITGQWYKADEQFLRTAIWFAFNGFGTILGSAIAYGIVISPDVYTIHDWKVLFIVIDYITISIGFMIPFHIPDLPVKV